MNLPPEILSRIVKSDGCWKWLGTHAKGYGRTSGGVGVHRVTYEAAKGPIPPGLVIDHLCRNPGCCNPDHLEAVTSAENTLRGISPPALNAIKTHCDRGHPLDEANTYAHPETGERTCRKCKSLRTSARYAKLDDQMDKAANGCWRWRGDLPTQHGPVWEANRLDKVRRMLFELECYPILGGRQIELACGTSHCCNPAHMRLTAPAVLRPSTTINSRKTHCIHGHEFTPENTRMVRQGKCRECRICARAARVRMRARQRAELGEARS